MKKILTNVLKQILILLIILSAIIMLYKVFVLGNIKGNYNSVVVLYDKEKDIRQEAKFLEEKFKEANNPKIIEIDAVGNFGNEHRIKSSNISEDESKFIENKLKERYPDEKINVSLIYNNMAANYSYNYIMYLIYFLIIVVLTFAATFMITKAEERKAA